MRTLRYLSQVFLLFLVYFVSGNIGLALDPVSGFATYVWFPTGICLAALYLFGYKLFPAVFLGALLVNFINDAPFFVALVIAFGNMLEALVGAYLLKRFHVQRTLETHNDILKLILLGAFVSTSISATIGVLSLFFGNILMLSSLFPTWIAWWIGDMVSVIIVTPLLLTWSAKPDISFLKKNWGEWIAHAVSTIVIGVTIFLGLPETFIKNPPLTHLVFPPLVWAALRFNQRVTIGTITLLSGFAVWGTAMGYGPFARDSLSESLYFLQSYMGVTAVTALILSSVVSERKHFENRKDEFIGMASHELKTPLTSIKMFTQLIQKKLKTKKDKELVRYIGRVDVQVNKLVRLVNDLLDVSRVQVQEFELKKENFLLGKLLKEVVSEIQTGASRHTIIVRGNSKKEIYADRQRIGQVISNLLTNAIKYSPQTKRIYLETQLLEDKVIIQVKDQGLGVSRENQKKIFSLFYRVKNGNTLPGFGVGLYVSSHIIKQHGGEIWVTSNKGRGSTFSISLPVYSR